MVCTPESEVGHVNGALTIGSTPYNWQALAYKAETNTGITTNSLTWTTTNPYGKDVRLNLVSSPASEILIEKNVGRIGGYDAKSEVYSPDCMVQNTGSQPLNTASPPSSPATPMNSKNCYRDCRYRYGTCYQSEFCIIR